MDSAVYISSFSSVRLSGPWKSRQGAESRDPGAPPCRLPRGEAGHQCCRDPRQVHHTASSPGTVLPQRAVCKRFGKRRIRALRQSRVRTGEAAGSPSTDEETEELPQNHNPRGWRLRTLSPRLAHGHFSPQWPKGKVWRSCAASTVSTGRGREYVTDSLQRRGLATAPPAARTQSRAHAASGSLGLTGGAQSRPADRGPGRSAHRTGAVTSTTVETQSGP